MRATRALATRALAIASSLVAALVISSPIAVNAATSARTITVIADLGAAKGAGKVYVELEIAGRTKLGIPQKLVDVPLATISVNAAGTRRLVIQVTSEVLKHVSSGMATYEFFARFGNQQATSTESLPVAPVRGNLAAIMTGTPQLAFSGYQKWAGANAAPRCVWTASGSAVRMSNLIGQMQDSAANGSEVDWHYGVMADSTFGVAVSDHLTRHYEMSGSFTITNKIGTNGGFKAGPGFNRFIYGHFYRQRYTSSSLRSGSPR